MVRVRITSEDKGRVFGGIKAVTATIPEIQKFDTDKDNGKINLKTPPEEIKRIHVTPMNDYWEHTVYDVSDIIPIQCKKINREAALRVRQALRFFASATPEAQARQKPIKVGVIDRGFQATPTLGRMQVYDQHGSPIVGNDGWFDEPDLHHGTLVASIVAGNSEQVEFQGFAPNSEILAISIPWADDDRLYLDGSEIPLAIKLLAEDFGVDIINLSGGIYFEPTDENGMLCEPDAELQKAFKSALKVAESKGVLCIAAAGNDRRRGVAMPACLDGVIGVGGVALVDLAPSGTDAHDEQDEVDLSDFSQCIDGFVFHPDPCTPEGEGIDVLGLSRFISGLDNNELLEYVGTSFAAPAVAGMLARQLDIDDEYQSIRGMPERLIRARSLLRELCVAIEPLTTETRRVLVKCGT